jgi:hypothetical protein
MILLAEIRGRTGDGEAGLRGRELEQHAAGSRKCTEWK